MFVSLYRKGLYRFFVRLGILGSEPNNPLILRGFFAYGPKTPKVTKNLSGLDFGRFGGNSHILGFRQACVKWPNFGYL